MSDKKQIEIKLSKHKLTLMFVGSIIFIGLGIWLVIDPSKFISIRIHSTTKIFIGGLAGIVFFGLCGIFIVIKLFDKRPGLIINDEGIMDNSSGLTVGQIYWRDVTKIKTTRVYRQNLLLLIVDNPETYIDRQKNIVKRKAMQLTLNIYDSPISISANGLQCSFEELKNILDAKFANFKTNKKVV